MAHTGSLQIPEEIWTDILNVQAFHHHRRAGFRERKGAVKILQGLSFFDNTSNTPGKKVFQGFGVPGRMILIAPAGL